MLSFAFLLLNIDDIPHFHLFRTNPGGLERSLARISLMMYLWHGIVIHLAVRYLNVSGLFTALIMMLAIVFLRLLLYTLNYG